MISHSIRWFLLGLAVAACALGSPSAVFAKVIYVDNIQGSDALDGTTPRPVGDFSGPVRTITRGLSLAEHADIVIIVNNNKPYYESLVLSGDRHSGEESAPFTIQGNGSVVSGAMPVPSVAWEEMAPSLWRFKPHRKGSFLLLLEGNPVPEFKMPADHAASVKAGVPLDVPVGNWTVFQGAIWFQAPRGYNPREEAFAFAAESMGISLFRVKNVLIQDLKLMHFRLDGVMAHDLVENVVLDRIVTVENGRAGVSVSGTSFVAIANSTIQNNRTSQVLLKGLGTIKVDNTEMSEEPTLLQE